MLATPQRGFALVIVVICSVAMVAIAIALVFTAGSSRLISVKGSAIDQSETIAIAGMERAVAYAERVADVERDYDLLLDPTASIDCNSLIISQTAPQSIGANSSGIPRFTDGNIASYENRRYRVVPFNSGAYLVRYDDDADDADSNPLWSPFTGNRPNGVACGEGPAFGKNNPFRDRNRAVWISVIGVYPGTDPDRAHHRTALRRFHVSTASLPGPAIHVAGDIDFDGDLKFCSNVGDIASGGSITFNAGDAACGRSAAAVAIIGTVPPAPVCPASHCTPAGGGTAPAPFTPPTVSDPDTLFWFNTTQPACNFYVIQGNPGGLFFWDVTRDPPNCADALTGPSTDALPSPPDVATIAAGAGLDTCWVPILVHDATDVFDTLGNDVVAGAGGSWRPGTTSGPFDIQDPLGLTFSGSGTKPDWSQCKVPWKKTGDLTCTGSCNGATTAASLQAGFLKFANTQALPPGMYRFAPSSTGTQNASTMFESTAVASMPTSDAPPPGNVNPFPLATFLVSGNFVGDDDVVLGIGQERSPFASLVAKNNITFPAGQHMLFAGSVVSLSGNILLQNGAFPVAGPAFNFHGMIVAASGSLTVEGGANLRVDYNEDLFGGVNGIPASATTSRTIR